MIFFCVMKGKVIISMIHAKRQNINFFFSRFVQNNYAIFEQSFQYLEFSKKNNNGIPYIYIDLQLKNLTPRDSPRKHLLKALTDHPLKLPFKYHCSYTYCFRYVCYYTEYSLLNKNNIGLGQANIFYIQQRI